MQLRSLLFANHWQHSQKGNNLFIYSAIFAKKLLQIKKARRILKAHQTSDVLRLCRMRKMKEVICLQNTAAQHYQLPAQAAFELRQMIVSKQMIPGQQLPSESELGNLFGVSRSTVREAVKLLVAENVVEIRRGCGTFVSALPGVGKDPLGLDFVNPKNLLRDLLETRMMIEPSVAALAAQRVTERDIKMMEDLLRGMEKNPNWHQEHASIDIKFHSLVAQCTQNEVMHRFLPVVCESIREGFYETVTIQGSQDRAKQAHYNIYMAIKNRNPAIARLETEKHILSTAQDAEIILGGK